MPDKPVPAEEDPVRDVPVLVEEDAVPDLSILMEEGPVPDRPVPVEEDPAPGLPGQVDSKMKLLGEEAALLEPVIGCASTTVYLAVEGQDSGAWHSCTVA